MSLLILVANFWKILGNSLLINFSFFLVFFVCFVLFFFCQELTRMV